MCLHMFTFRIRIGISFEQACQDPHGSIQSICSYARKPSCTGFDNGQISIKIAAEFSPRSVHSDTFNGCCVKETFPVYFFYVMVLTKFNWVA